MNLSKRSPSADRPRRSLRRSIAASAAPETAAQAAQASRTSSVELFVQAQSILHHVTRTGYTGNLSSPFFGTATSVGAPRDINVGLRFNF